MVWFHGGGFTQGSGGDVRYDGSNLARNHNVVLVTVNHRLNVLGFLNLSEIGGPAYAGSVKIGMNDLFAAHRWVCANIAQFGGDPDNGMITGQ